MDLARLRMLSPEGLASRRAKEAETDSALLLRLLARRRRRPKEPVPLGEFPFSEAARREFVPRLRASLKVHFK